MGSLKFRLEIDCDNDAFKSTGTPDSPMPIPDREVNGYEIWHILKRVMRKVDDSNICLFKLELYDSNGNIVGFAELKEE